MATPPIDYEAVIADLEAKIVHLQATLAGIRAVAGMTGLGTAPTPGAPSGGGGGNPIVNGKPASDAFLGKSIPEAAKMYLTSQRRNGVRESAPACERAADAGVVCVALDSPAADRWSFREAGYDGWPDVETESELRVVWRQQRRAYQSCQRLESPDDGAVILRTYSTLKPSLARNSSVGTDPPVSQSQIACRLVPSSSAR